MWIYFSRSGKVLFKDKLMRISSSDRDCSFQGRVYYANKTAELYAPKYREIIHQLKHYTANKELSHHIFLDRFKSDEGFYMKIVTKYEHEKKVGGVDAHILENAYIGNDFSKAKLYFLNNMNEINSWKRIIDMTHSHENDSIDFKHKGISIWTKIRKLLHL